MSKIAIIATIIWALAASAQADVINPIGNPSFEDGAFSPWVAYQYAPSPPLSYGSAVPPTIGVAGSTFNLLPPYERPDGMYVCGMESPATTSKNGGVFQTFSWGAGGGNLTVRARAQADGISTCYVRVGVAQGSTSSRSAVTNWVSTMHGMGWTTLTVPVSGSSSTHTVFIEAYQPGGTGLKMSTLWDDVRWVPYLTITQEPTLNGVDPLHPDTTARIVWKTNLPAASRVDYQSGNGDWQFATNSTVTTEHSVLITNLLPGKTCTYRVSNSSQGCVDVTSGNYSFKTPTEISEVSATTGNPDVTVTWKTDAPTNSYVDYGLTTAYGQSAGSADMVLNHSVTLTGLQDAKTYHFRVRSGGGNYTEVTSEDHTFRTLPAPQAVFGNPGFERLQGGVPDLYPWEMYMYDPAEIQIDGVLGPYPASGTDSWFSNEVGIKAYEGSYFLGAGARYIYKNGGVYQRVILTRPQTVALTARFATYQSAEGGPKDTRVDIGIDPTGGMDPNAATVKWWRGGSPSNGSDWHPGGIVTDAPAGIVTLFVGTRQLFGLTARAVAIDDVFFGEPQEMSIGALRNSRKCPGAILKNVFVTHIHPIDIRYEDKTYRKVYVQEAGVPAGMGVLLGPIDPENPPDLPLVGNKVTVTGTLVRIGRESVLMGYKWTVDHADYDLPAPLALKQRDIGGSAYNQVSLTRPGICNLGVRVKVFGKVNWPEIGLDGDVYIDDGSRLQTNIMDYDQPVTGVRVRLRENGLLFYKGDYIAATGVLTLENTASITWPNYEYVITMSEKDEWSVLQPGENSF